MVSYSAEYSFTSLNDASAAICGNAAAARLKSQAESELRKIADAKAAAERKKKEEAERKAAATDRNSGRVTDNGHEGVQLWKDGPYWATTNVGADKPHDYGLYFWWGDTVGYRRSGSSWVASDRSNRNFSFDSGNTPTYKKSESELKRSGWLTSAGVLAPAHDAAHAHWGGAWRMPTDAELQALVNNCDWFWTSQNGTSGYLVSGRGAYSSASIFLPAAGFGHGTSLGNAGSVGYYWSSVPNSDSEGARSLYFNSGNRHVLGDGRDYGRSVRPVRGFAK